MTGNFVQHDSISVDGRDPQRLPYWPPPARPGAPIFKSLFIDLSPLAESRQYRLLYTGQIISLLGRQVTIVAVAIQVFDLTGSTLAVGLLGLSQFPALVIGSFLGGTLADAMDRRRLLIYTQLFMAATTAGLALNAATDAPLVWVVFALTAANAFGSAIDSPARTAAVPNLVSTRRLPAAYALQVLMFQSGAAVGPAIGGVVISQTSLAVAYWADTVSFGAALVTLFLMAPLLPEGGGTRAGLRSIGEGMRFLKDSRTLQGTFIIDINAMVFGMPRALFPEWGLETLGGTEATVGLLYAAPAAGALLAGVFSGWVNRIVRAGRSTVVAVVVWGLAITVFGLTTSLVAALLFLGIAGAADAASAVFRQTILQVTTPDRLRGRLSAVQIAVVAGGPRVGDAEAGAVAALFNPRVAAWSGGLVSAIGALVVARLFPEFSRWMLPEARRTTGEEQPSE